MKILHKAQLAGAVMLATAGVAVGTAQAESLLAPLVINSSVENGDDWRIETYLSMRTGASLDMNSPYNLHYRWIQKNHPSTLSPELKALEDELEDGKPKYIDTPMKALGQLDRECKMINSFGKATPRDMIYQTTAGSADFKALPRGFVGSSEDGLEASQPSGFPGDFAGMLVIDADGTQEGNFSGFAYIIDTENATMIDYKLLNNHHSTVPGNFAAGFISKKSIDYSWLPDTLASTEWYTAVTSKNMGAYVEDSAHSIYDATVTIGNYARVELDGTSNQRDPWAIQGGIGVFDNDENFISGAPDFNVTCVGLYSRTKFIDPSQEHFTENGGWTRRSITPVKGKKIDAKGAITYKWEKSKQDGPYAALLNGRNAVSFQVETSGNLSTKKSHANKPY